VTSETVGQLADMRGGSRDTPAIPTVSEAEFENKRANVVRLLPNGFQERKLRKLADISAKLFNELNYERRQQFFSGKEVDFKGTWDKHYQKYKSVLSVNAQAVMQKNNEAWSSFFSLLRLKKEGKLPPHMDHVSPPRYWKDRENKNRKKILVVRQDRYEVDEKNHKLILKDFNMEVDFVGRLRWYGKQGRLEIICGETTKRWYAHIPVEVGVEKTKTGKHSSR
jgi:putative transposase